jgi:hypothetical protein
MLERLAIRRLPSARVARQRVRIKRRLRRAGICFRNDIPTRELIALAMLLPRT